MKVKILLVRFVKYLVLAALDFMYTFTEINVWNECGRLIANAIIFYNAYLLSALMEQKEAEGDMEAVEFIRKLSPIACQHINFNGLFLFNSGEEGIDVDATLELLDKILKSAVKK